MNKLFDKGDAFLDKKLDISRLLSFIDTVKILVKFKAKKHGVN
jgi:hypothetical protein